MDCIYWWNVLHCRSFLICQKAATLKKLARPIYVKMGIIPELATGIQNATELSIHRK